MAEPEHERDAGHHQDPVHRRDVDLTEMRLGRVDDPHARAVAELHSLLRERVGTGDQRLRGDHCGHRGKHDERVERPVRRHPIEGVIDRTRVVDEQRALPEVHEHEARQHQPVPAELDRATPEVAHVGVERLAADNDEDHCAEHEEPGRAVVGEELARRTRATSRGARAVPVRCGSRRARRSSRTRRS